MKIILGQLSYKSAPERRGWLGPALSSAPRKISSFSTRRAVFKFCRQRGAPRRAHALMQRVAISFTTPDPLVNRAGLLA